LSAASLFWSFNFHEKKKYIKNVEIKRFLQTIAKKWKVVPSFRKSLYKRDNYLIKENESENKICQTHRKNGFTKVFQNLATDLNIILLNYQNNYKTFKFKKIKL